MIFWKDIDINGENRKILYASNDEGDELIFPNNTYWINKLDKKWFFESLMLLKDRNLDPKLFNNIESEYNKLCNEEDNQLRVIYSEVGSLYPDEVQTVTFIVEKDFKTGKFKYTFESSQDGLILNTTNMKYLEGLIDKKPNLKNKPKIEQLTKILHQVSYENSNISIPDKFVDIYYQYQSTNAIDVLDYYIITDDNNHVFGVGVILNFEIDDKDGSPKFVHDFSARVLKPCQTLLITSDS